MNDIEGYSNNIPPATWPWSLAEWRRFNNITLNPDLAVDTSEYTPYADLDKIMITTNTTIDATIDTHRDIVVSDCPKCGSNLPIREVDDKGICTCKFCGKDVYVW